MVGGIDHEGDLAAAKLRIRVEQNAGSLAESQRLRREEAEEQFNGRLWALTIVALIYALILLFG
ncbi:MAG: hypothetical protein Tsb0032_39850 [Kiloniellaceae bacterium]